MRTSYRIVALLSLLAVATVPTSHADPVRRETRDLVQMAKVTRADCLFCAGIMLGGRGAPTTLPGIRGYLARAGVAAEKQFKNPEEMATRGYACLLFMKALGEHRSLIYSIFGPSERYAYKHLKYLRMIPEGGSSQPITGAELVSLLSLSRQKAAQRGGRRAP